MRERCKSCGAFMGFDMGPEGDGDFICNNKRCKSILNDWRIQYGENAFRNEVKIDIQKIINKHKNKFGTINGYCKWELTIKWLDTDNDTFFKTYGFSYVPSQKLQDLAWKEKSLVLNEPPRKFLELQRVKHNFCNLNGISFHPDCYIPPTSLTSALSNSL